MATDVSWNVQSLSPDARETAREAARRSGMSVTEWLQSVILESAAGDHARNANRPAGTPAEDLRHHGSEESAAGALQQNGHLGTVNARIDELAAQIAQLSRTATAIPAAAVRQPSVDAGSFAGVPVSDVPVARTEEQAPARAAVPVQDISAALTRLDKRLDQLAGNSRPAGRELRRAGTSSGDVFAGLAFNASPALAAASSAPEAGSGGAVEPALSVPAERNDWAAGVDRAFAEITARQHALNGSLDAPRPAPATALPGPDLSGLERQLRQLTEQVENLRGPGAFADAIDVLRQELSDIERRLTEAVPRRALEALQAEVRALAERIDQGRQQGADADALATIERSLAEIREALHGLAPAESLAAFHDDVRALDRKIDLVAAQSDSTALRQLERAVSELGAVAARAASGDALIALAEEVQALSDKIDRFAVPVSGPEILSSLDQRFHELAAALEARTSSAGSTSDNLAAVIESLADKLERVELSRDTTPALDQIAHQLARLTERLEASGARLDNLEALERGLSELFDQFEGLRAGAMVAAERAAKEAARELASRSEAGPVVDTLKDDISALKHEQARSDQRTQDTLEAVHDTLERLVDRLAMIETDIRGELRTPQIGVAVAPAAAALRVSDLDMIPASGAPRLTPGPLEATRRPAPTASAMAGPAAPERRPIDPTLPADHPLEPGTAQRGRPPASPAERIAASEAALGSARPIAEADSKSNFIAAARRAAQAAANMAGPAGAEPEKAGASGFGALAQKITGRRPLMLGLAILLVAGTLHLIVNMVRTNEGKRSEVARPVAVEPVVPARETAKIGNTLIKPAATTTVATAPSFVTAPATGATPPASTSPIERATAREPAAIPSIPPRESSTPAAAESAPIARPQEPDARTTATVSPLTIASLKLPANLTTGSIGAAPTAGRAEHPAGAPMALAPATTTDLPVAIGAGLRTAALGGNPAAAYEVALRYAEGRGAQTNLEEAARWFQRAADQGVAPAQYRLGSLYEKGQGVKKDLEKARRLYRSAADKGHAKAMHNLAVLHAEGIDGKPDFNVAAQWFRKAADHGVADSQYNLGILHARGLGADQNLADSYKWFALAAQQGDQDAGKKRDDVANRLDQQALAGAKQAAQTFVAAPQPEEATSVKAPEGGWERSSASTKPRTTVPAARRTGT